MSIPAISICIPTYNRGALLEKNLRRLLSWAYQDFEVVVTDDSSTDDTEARIRAINDPRLHYFRHPQNVGISLNWTKCIELATAPLVIRLDDDDYFDEHFLPAMVDLFQRNPRMVSAYAGYAYTYDYQFGQNVAVIDRGLFKGREVIPGHEFIRAYLMHEPFPGVHPASVVFRREAAAEVGYFHQLTDHSFALALAALGDIGYLPVVHFYYVQHETGRVSNTKPMDMLERCDPLAAYRWVYESHVQKLRDLPELQTFRKQARHKLLRVFPAALFYGARVNYHSRRLVWRTAYRIAEKYPEVMLSPLFLGSVVVMMAPESLLRRLMAWYRGAEKNTPASGVP